MSSPAVQEYGSGYRVSPASRLIPGSPFNGAVPVRKKPQSVPRDDRYWTDDSTTAPEADSTQSLSEMRLAILPAPAHGGETWRVGLRAGADFLLASVSLAAIFCVPILSALALQQRIGLMLTFGALLTLIAHSEGLYRGNLSFERERIVLGKAVAWATLIAAAPLLRSPGSLKMIALNAPLSYFALMALRAWQCAQEQDSSHSAARRVLIVGAGIAGRRLAAQLEGNRPRREVCGFLDNEVRQEADVLGGIAELAQVARAQFVDEVIVTDRHPREMLQRILREARKNRLDVKLVADNYGVAARPLALEHFGEMPVLTLHEEPIPMFGLVVKRSLDIVFSAVALLTLAPALALIAAAIKLDSPGPAIYRATRVGKKGGHFRCYKFRSMDCDAEKMKEQLRARNERSGPFFKIADDPRITRLGRFLRRYSLDELPQLLNVLKGEMSLVGPRPHPLDDCSRYRLEDLRRLDVVPGLTGLWQVSARKDPSFESSMALDLEYIERWTLGLDLRILLRTAAVVLQGSGV